MKVIHLPQQEVETKDNEEQKEGSKTSRELPTRPTHLLGGHQTEQVPPQIFTTADVNKNFSEDIKKAEDINEKSSPSTFTSFLNFSLQVFVFLQQLIYAIQALKVIN